MSASPRFTRDELERYAHACVELAFRELPDQQLELIVEQLNRQIFHALEPDMVRIHSAQGEQQ